jgi:hypothetical protein
MHLHPVMAVCGVLGLRDQPQTDLSAEEGSDTVALEADLAGPCAWAGGHV